MDNNNSSGIILAVPRVKVKTIKNALEAHNLLDRSVKITSAPCSDKFHISVKNTFSSQNCHVNGSSQDVLLQVLFSIGMEDFAEDVEIAAEGLPPCNDSSMTLRPGHIFPNDTTSKGRDNPLTKTIETWYNAVLASTNSRSVGEVYQTSSSACQYVPTFRSTSGYNVYPPLLLLHYGTLSDYLKDDRFISHLPSLYRSLSEVFGVTHIALNAPIPASNSETDISSTDAAEHLISQPNILRSPTNITPVYGDFGPALPTSHIPTAANFKAAFWCLTKQNAIYQSWAPRYTMFSRGNVSEKTRIYELTSSRVQSELEDAFPSYVPERSTAVDLYAGIGYFAFSYVKSGVAKVVCWEINPWSVEGLSRGARMNKWSAVTFRENEFVDDTMLDVVKHENPRILTFQESNEHATARIKRLRGHLPPVRHVNCGYLPSSKASWKTAVAAVDPRSGGWIHAHENVAKEDIEQRRGEIVDRFRDLVEELYGPSHIMQRLVSCTHIERVKSYAPGVIHCVFDIAVSGSVGT